MNTEYVRLSQAYSDWALDLAGLALHLTVDERRAIMRRLNQTAQLLETTVVASEALGEEEARKEREL